MTTFLQKTSWGRLLVLQLALLGLLPAQSVYASPGRYICPQAEDAGVGFECSLNIPDFGVFDQTQPLSIFIWVFYAAMALTAALTVTMLVVGGIRYIGSAGNAGQQGRAKQQIWNAILGLVLALSSILILRTINADFARVGFPEIVDDTTQNINQTDSEQKIAAFCDCLTEAADPVDCQDEVRDGPAIGTCKSSGVADYPWLNACKGASVGSTCTYNTSSENASALPAAEYTGTCTPGIIEPPPDVAGPVNPTICTCVAYDVNYCAG